MKAVKHFLLFISCLLCVNCWDITIKVLVSENGNVKLDVLSKADCAFLPKHTQAALFYDADFERTSQWRRGGKCYFKGSKWGAVKDFEVGKFTSVHVSGGKSTGFFSNTYKFHTYLGELKRDQTRNPFARALLGDIRFHYVVTLPGKIQKTNGKISNHGKTASFHYSLYSLNRGRKKIYVQSKKGRYENFGDAEYKASLLWEKKQQELYSVETRLKELEYKLGKEKKIKLYKDKHSRKANNQIIALFNKFVLLYKEAQGELPASEAELLDFLEQKGIDVDELPQLIGADLSYDIEKHRYQIERSKKQI